jgi:hypothetical protein
MAFYPPSTGEWVISSTYSGVPYQTSATITSLATPVSASLQQLPDGKTVTPTDDIQKWLNCAGIFDKTSYTTLADVLSDSTTLLALMSNNNAVDYLVRSTTWASGVTANSTAMTDIGANNYCANTLLDDATWCDAICNSTYFESVLNVKVPTMTSDTTPSGNCIANSYRSDRQPYKAFDGSNTTIYTSSDGELIGSFYLAYKFPSAVKVRKVRIYADSYSASSYFDNAVYGGNSLSNLTKLSSDMRNQAASGSPKWLEDSFVNINAYTYYAIKITGSNETTSNGSNWYNGIYTLQFYGREDV